MISVDGDRDRKEGSDHAESDRYRRRALPRQRSKLFSDWYERNLGVDITERTWVQESGQTVFSPFKIDSDYFGRPEQQWMICFRVAGLNAMIAQLKANGIEAIQKEEWNSEVGPFARIHDPEGNPIELWQPSVQSAINGG